MKKYRLISAFFVLLLSFSSCKNDKKIAVTTYQCPMKCEENKTYEVKGSCPICKMDLKLVENQTTSKLVDNEISDESIFNLTSKWNTEEGESIELKHLKGKTLVMVMIYTTCKSACPRLVADMRNIEKQIPTKYNQNLSYVLVSIDPETDTPERLKSFAKDNLMDDEHWTFLQGELSGVREFANVLAVKYKQISPLDFSHSNIISVFNPDGELIHQQEGLGVDNKETIEKIIESVSTKKGD